MFASQQKFAHVFLLVPTLCFEACSTAAGSCIYCSAIAHRWLQQRYESADFGRFLAVNYFIRFYATPRAANGCRPSNKGRFRGAVWWHDIASSHTLHTIFTRFLRFKKLQKDGNYYVVVIEDTSKKQLVATATVFVEHKFLRGCGKVFLRIHQSFDCLWSELCIRLLTLRMWLQTRPIVANTLARRKISL